MYSANDWRNYTLLHAMSNLDRESKWEWPGGNNSKAYNDWYYSHHKDKWRQYYLNKKKKQGNTVDPRQAMKLFMKVGRDARSGNAVRYTKAAAVTERINALDRNNPELFNKVRPVVEGAAEAQRNAEKVHNAIDRIPYSAFNARLEENNKRRHNEYINERLKQRQYRNKYMSFDNNTRTDYSDRANSKTMAKTDGRMKR